MYIKGHRQEVKRFSGVKKLLANDTCLIQWLHIQLLLVANKKSPGNSTDGQAFKEKIYMANAHTK